MLRGAFHEQNSFHRGLRNAGGFILPFEDGQHTGGRLLTGRLYYTWAIKNHTPAPKTRTPQIFDRIAELFDVSLHWSQPDS